MPSHPTPPRRKPSAAVYRRRRQVVGAALAVVLLLLGWGIGALVNALTGGRGDAPEAASSASPTASAVSSPMPAAARSLEAEAASSSLDPSETRRCEESDLRLTAGVAQEEVKRGESLAMTLTVRNLSASPCTADVGTAAQAFVVADESGEDVMTTRKCQVDPTHEDLVIDAQSEKTATYTWNGRTPPESCVAEGPAPEPGRHLLTVELGELSSRSVAFEILENEDYRDPGPSPSEPGETSDAASSSDADASDPEPSDEPSGSSSSADAEPSDAASSSDPEPSGAADSASPEPSAEDSSRPSAED